MKNLIPITIATILFAISTVIIANIPILFISIFGVLILTIAFAIYMNAVERAIAKWLFIQRNVNEGSNTWQFIDNDLVINYIPGYYPIMMITGATLYHDSILHSLVKKHTKTTDMITNYTTNHDIQYRFKITMSTAEKVIEYINKCNEGTGVSE